MNQTYLAIVLVVVSFVALALLRRSLFMLAARLRRFTSGSSALSADRGGKSKLELIADRDDDSTCAVCGSERLTRQGEGTYRCRACGYEGGSGRSKLESARLRDGWGARPRTERKRAAMEDLVAAKRILCGPGLKERSSLGAAPTALGLVVRVDTRPALLEVMEEARRDLVGDLRAAAGFMHEAQIKLTGLDVMDPDMDYQEAAWRVEPSKLEILKRRFERELQEAMAKVMALPD